MNVDVLSPLAVLCERAIASPNGRPHVFMAWWRFFESDSSQNEVLFLHRADAVGFLARLCRDYAEEGFDADNRPDLPEDDDERAWQEFFKQAEDWEGGIAPLTLFSGMPPDGIYGL